MSKLTIAAFSDTHTHHTSVTLPDADVLVFAGDLMGSGYRHQEVRNFAAWLSKQPYKYKIVVAGNHDRMFETDKAWCLKQFSDIIYLENQDCVINGFQFWGSPVQPEFYNWAFNVPRGTAIKKYWDMIPPSTDVLITHGPPRGVLDQMTYDYKAERLGCQDLMNAVDKISPKVHIFGHIHNSYGHISRHTADRFGTHTTDFYNVAICDEEYQPTNKPYLIEVEK